MLDRDSVHAVAGRRAERGEWSPQALATADPVLRGDQHRGPRGCAARPGPPWEAAPRADGRRQGAEPRVPWGGRPGLQGHHADKPLQAPPWRCCYPASPHEGRHSRPRPHPGFPGARRPAGSGEARSEKNKVVKGTLGSAFVLPFTFKRVSSRTHTDTCTFLFY